VECDLGSSKGGVKREIAPTVQHFGESLFSVAEWLGQLCRNLFFVSIWRGFPVKYRDSSQAEELRSLRNLRQNDNSIFGFFAWVSPGKNMVKRCADN